MREYNSSLGSYIIGLIRQKQACGYVYEHEAYILLSPSTDSALNGITLREQ